MFILERASGKPKNKKLMGSSPQVKPDRVKSIETARGTLDKKIQHLLGLIRRPEAPAIYQQLTSPLHRQSQAVVMQPLTQPITFSGKFILEKV